MKRLHKRRLRYLKYLERIPSKSIYLLPPSIAISYAHNINPRYVPLMNRRTWKRKYHTYE